MGQKYTYSCECANQSLFLCYYLLILVLFFMWTYVNVLLPHPVCIHVHQYIGSNCKCVCQNKHSISLVINPQSCLRASFDVRCVDILYSHTYTPVVTSQPFHIGFSGQSLSFPSMWCILTLPFGSIQALTSFLSCKRTVSSAFETCSLCVPQPEFSACTSNMSHLYQILTPDLPCRDQCLFQ